MKNSFKNIFLIVLGVLIGFGLSFFNLPDLSNAYEFGWGVIAAVSLIFTFKLLTEEKRGREKRTNRIRTILFVTLIIALGFGANLLINKQHKFALEEIQAQNKVNLYQAELLKQKRELQGRLLVDSTLNSGIIDSLRALDSLSPYLTNGLSRLSYQLKPFRYSSSSDSTWRYLSPARGYLLIRLIELNLDSTIFSQIVDTLSFAYADLEGVDLSSFYFQGINLSYANLSKANLKGTSFINSDLNHAQLNASQLANCKLKNVNLELAQLDWSNLNGSTIDSSNLDGVSINNSQLKNSRVSNSIMRYAKFNSSNFKSATFISSKVFRCSLFHTNFDDSSFLNCDLSKSYFGETSFNQAIFNNTQLDPRWLSSESELDIIDLKNLIKRHSFSKDTTSKYLKVFANAKHSSQTLAE